MAVMGAAGCDSSGLKRTLFDAIDTAAAPPKAPSRNDQTLAVAHKNDQLGTPSFAFGDMRERQDLLGIPHAAAARTYLNEYAATFVLQTNDKTLLQKSVHEPKIGPVIVAFERRVGGYPVLETN